MKAKHWETAWKASPNTLNRMNAKGKMVILDLEHDEIYEIDGLLESVFTNLGADVPLGVLVTKIEPELAKNSELKDQFLQLFDELVHKKLVLPLSKD